MANDINKEDPHYKGEYGSIYEVNRQFPTGGVAGDFVVIEGWAHYWNADRGTWCVNAERDSYWDELITNIIEKFKLVRGATYMGVASLDTVPAKAIGAKMYYFATVAGKYKNFDNLVVPQGINVLYSENGSSWVNTTLLEVAQELGEAEDKVMSQKAVSDKLSDLNINLTDLGNQTFQTYSIDGEFVDTNGVCKKDSSRPFCRTDYINIKYADKIVINESSSSQYFCTVAFYDKNKKFIEGIINPLNMEAKYSGVIESSNFPKNAEYAIATSYTTYENRQFKTVLPTTKIIDLFDSTINNTEQSITDIIQSTTPKYINGFIDSNGDLIDSGGSASEPYCRTGYLWIKNTDYIKIVGAYTSPYLTSYAFYDENKQVLELHKGTPDTYAILDDITILKENIPEKACYLAVTSLYTHTDKKVFIKSTISEVVPEILETVKTKTTQAISPDTILTSEDIKDYLTEYGWIMSDGTIYNDKSWINGKIEIPSGTKYLKMSNWDKKPDSVVHLLFLNNEDSIIDKVSLKAPYIESLIPSEATKVHLCIRESYKNKFRFGFFYSKSTLSIDKEFSSLRQEIYPTIGGTVNANLAAVNQSGFIDYSGNPSANGSWVHGIIPFSSTTGTIIFSNLPDQSYAEATVNFFVDKDGNKMAEGSFRGNKILGAGVVEMRIPNGAYGLMLSASAENIGTYDIKIVYDNSIQNNRTLCCPDKYYAIVGKEFNIYYDSVIQALDNGILSPFGIYVDIECPDLQNGAAVIGVRKDRMWQINGNKLTDSYIGDHDMWISAWDNVGKLIDRKKAILTVSPNSQLSTNKRILCIGDSLTANGPIVATCGSHFKDLGGIQPIFIGQRSTSGYKHEGYPGYTFESFTEDASNYAYTIFDVPQGTNVSIGDKYSTNNTNFEIEDIRTEGLDNALRLRCRSASGSDIPPSVGVLTKISGQSTSDESVNYTAVEKESGNPFWDSDTGANNFTKYREKMGMGSSKFDIVVIMLGTNDCIGNIRTNVQSTVDAAVKLIDSILADAGDYHTKIIIQMTPPDASSISSWQVYPDSSGSASGKKMGFWHNLWNLRALLYNEFTKDKWSGKVYIGQAALGIDRYYGYPYTMVESSSRINIKEVFHDNSVHPNLQGYQQLGDGYYLQVKALL